MSVCCLLLTAAVLSLELSEGQLSPKLARTLSPKLVPCHLLVSGCITFYKSYCESVVELCK